MLSPVSILYTETTKIHNHESTEEKFHHAFFHQSVQTITYHYRTRSWYEGSPIMVNIIYQRDKSIYHPNHSKARVVNLSSDSAKNVVNLIHSDIII